MTTPTVRAALDWATARLATTPSSTPCLDAELLLGATTGKTRTQILGWPDNPLTARENDDFVSLVEQRAGGVPVSYLVGTRDFMELQLQVGPGALVPRPETELLVDWCRSFLARQGSLAQRLIVDVGTGPGTILFSLATHPPLQHARFIGADVSAPALEWARRNLQTFALQDRVELVRGDLLTWFGGRALLVTANLPYLRADQIAGNWELSAEPVIALDGGVAGLELIARLVDSLPSILADNGAVVLEIDPSQVTAVVALLGQTTPWLNVVVHRDLAGFDRFVSAAPG